VQLPSAARAPQLRDTRLDNPRLIGHEASAAADFPRELGDGELAALLRNADRPTRAAIVLLLAGASPQELARLRWSDIDLADGKVQTPAPSPRRLAFDRAALPWLQDAAQGGDGAALLGASDGDAALEQLGSQLMCAAHDGGLDRPHEVTAEAIRHTYIAFLVRQGARFADITRWVGPLPTRLLSAYSELVPTGPRHDEASIERTHPAIRGAVG
jgi:integrase